MENKIKNIFIEGAISAEFIANAISKHQHKTKIGAHNIFLGQVRADTVENKTVVAIEFSAQQDMANIECNKITESAFEKYDLSCLHVYHSLGKVNLGEICFFVFVSSPHRQAVFEAIPFLVDQIKAKVPIFGKEIFDDSSYQWKINNIVNG